MRPWLFLAAGTALIGALWGLLVWITAPRVELQKAQTTQAQAQTVEAQAQGRLDTTAAKVAATEVIHERTIQTTLPMVERQVAQAPGSDDYLDPRNADAFLDGLRRVAAPAAPERGAHDPSGSQPAQGLPDGRGPGAPDQPGHRPGDTAGGAG